MQLIEDAIEDNDADGLKALFSPTALEQATDLDDGLHYFLSTFDSGRITWESAGIHSASATEGSKQTIALFCSYNLVADGKKYELYFAYYPVNDVVDPQNVGMYALGVAPHEEDRFTASGEPKPFYKWQGSYQFRDHVSSGVPGVYIPQS